MARSMWCCPPPAGWVCMHVIIASHSHIDYRRQEPLPGNCLSGCGLHQHRHWPCLHIHHRLGPRKPAVSHSTNVMLTRHNLILQKARRPGLPQVEMSFRAVYVYFNQNTLASLHITHSPILTRTPPAATASPLLVPPQLQL